MTGKPFGETIKAARQRLGLSLRELGERVRRPDGAAFSPQYLNDIEHGRRNPPDEAVIQLLATALELDVQTLLAMAGKEPAEIREYLADMPEEREIIGRLFRMARERKFKDWDRIASEIGSSDKEGKKK